MISIERVKMAISKWYRQKRTFDTLLGHLPHGDRRPTIAPRP